MVIACSCVCVGHSGRPRACGPRATLVTYTHAAICAIRNNHLSRTVRGDNYYLLVQKFSLRSATEGSGQQQVVFFLHVQQRGPQGSVLGPLLFNIYVADLPSLAREHGAKMPSFADDMTLYCSHTSAALACSSVSAALKDTSCVLALRGLSINVSKTVAMVIAPHSRHAKVSQRACGFCCRMRKLNSFHKLVF